MKPQGKVRFTAPRLTLPRGFHIIVTFQREA
jgi:hypothetical protein